MSMWFISCSVWSVLLFCRLILHYSQHLPSRSKTFKYLVLMCDECVHMHAYSDVAAYADRACTLAISRTELRVLLVVLDCVTNALHAKTPTKLLFFTTRSDAVMASINQVMKNVKTRIAAIDIAKGNKSASGDEDRSVSKSFSVNKKAERSVSISGVSVSLRRDASKRLDWAPSFSNDETGSKQGMFSACTIC